MEKRIQDSPVSVRLKTLVERRFPKRGRFGELEAISGIGLNRWKNFYYGKQDATQEMLQFWCSKYPNDSDWLLSGVEAPSQKEFPFTARVPKKWEGQTVGDRLNWVISEWAFPSGEQLFAYLEEKSGQTIAAAEWAQVIMRTKPPTLEMVGLVARYRPHFTEWVIRGAVGKNLQVDPTDADSIERWKEMEEKLYAEFVGVCPSEGGNDD